MPTPTPVPVAFLFDLDGTLIESRIDIARACNHALVTLGRSALPEDTIAGFVGDGARTLLAKAFDLPSASEEIDQALRVFVEYYAEHPVVRTELLPGALEALVDLAGHPLGLVTNKTRTVTLRILEALDIHRYFG